MLHKSTGSLDKHVRYKRTYTYLYQKYIGVYEEDTI